MPEAWYENHAKLIAFATVLVNAGALDAPGNDRRPTRTAMTNLLYFFEKPWKWTPEYEEWAARRGVQDAAE